MCHGLKRLKDEQFQRRCTRSTTQRERWQKTRRPRSKNAGRSRRMPCSRARSADWEAECALRRGGTAACVFLGHLTQVSRILGFVQRPGLVAPTPRSYAGCSGKVAKAPGHPIFPIFRQFRRTCRAVHSRGRYFPRSFFWIPSFVRQDSKQTSTTHQP